ncbi:ABC transporter permease subunit [Cellulomonas sp. URHD0024]|uniref:ABC transporter permease subunit n=1 Tax=Cellulomonas sp. URHD0024 TaxID=1302620 RepID=UPI000415AA71|nr:ABC transporter permease subunit [Cellulomonas sp. URHD0024]
MSTAVATPPTTPVAAAPPKGRLSFLHLLRSEWIKFWSVRSTFWTLGTFLVTMVAMILLFTLALKSASDPSDPDATNALAPFILGVAFGQFAVAVLGALTITGEYSTGMIRTSLSAAPKRLPVLWSKGIVAGLSMFGVALIGVAVSAALQWLFFHDNGLGVDLGNSQHVRALIGTALYIATIGLLAFAFGALMRHSAAAVSSVLGLILLVPIVLQLVPWKPLQEIAVFLPGSVIAPSAGLLITFTDREIADFQTGSIGAHLTAWQGYGVLVAWVLVILAVAAILLKRRDA